jgi:hypothetical protein
LSRTAWVALVLGTAIAVLLAAVARIVSRKAEEDRASLSWLREQVSIRASLTRELNHRVKNTLANVLSIALTKRRATGLDQFVEGLQGRIRALSATHDLLTDREWGPRPASGGGGRAGPLSAGGGSLGGADRAGCGTGAQ